MLKGTALAALALVSLAAAAPAVEIDGRFPQMVDLPTAYTLPRAAYTIGARIAPGGTLVAGFRVGIVDYISAGFSYGARNAIGTGDPDWENRVEFDAKVRVLSEDSAIMSLAAGYDSRGYGRQFESGSFEKASPGLFVVGSRALPFSEYWQGHGGVSRTLEHERARPSFFVGIAGRFSKEFSVIGECQLGTKTESDGDSSTECYLNAGLRWLFSDRVQLDFLFRNLVGSSDSPELSSRSIVFTFYDSF